MGTECDDTQFQHVLLQYIVVYQIIQDPVENQIGCPCYSIPEELYRHIFAEWRIKKVDFPPDNITNRLKKFIHAGPKIRILQKPAKHVVIVTPIRQRIYRGNFSLDYHFNAGWLLCHPFLIPIFYFFPTFGTGLHFASYSLFPIRNFQFGHSVLDIGNLIFNRSRPEPIRTGAGGRLTSFSRAGISINGRRFHGTF
jgi:hypothetical protein